MVLKVVPATELDAARALAIENAAYGPNPVGDILYPGPPPVLSDGPDPRVAHLIDQLHADPACRWVKVVDTEIEQREGDGDPMISFAMWYLWDTPQPPTPPEHWGEGTNPEACELFFGEMRKRRNAKFAGKSFVFLKLLHTDPKHQRRGAGSMLLRWGAAEADRLGLDSYLESSPEGRPLYEKMGYKELETFVVDFSKWGGPNDHPTVLMLRNTAST